MKIQVMETKQAAIDAGFAGFNTCKHVCVDLPQDYTTISVRSPDGGLMTISFVPRPADRGIGHQVADVVYHSGKKNENGYPIQRAALLGAGPTIARSMPDDKIPTTVVTVNMYQTE